MSRFIVLIFGVLFSTIVYGQFENEIKPSFTDSVLLNNFWTDFQTAINTNDKAKLKNLCEFPFYCRPCIDDTTLKHNDHITIKVSKKLFTQSQYKVFFDKPLQDEVKKYEHFEVTIFHRYTENLRKPNNFFFFYTIIPYSDNAPSMQGVMSLDKENGKYKISGIDIIP